jgi:hypothetical protein
VRKGKSDIPKRTTRFREVRVNIKPKTAENLHAASAAVDRAKAALADAERNLMNHMLPLLTEHGLEGCRQIEVTEKAPWQLVAKIPK